MAKTKIVMFKKRVQLVEGGKEYARGSTHTDVPADDLKGWYAEALVADGDIVIGGDGGEEVTTPDGAPVANGSTANAGRNTRTGRG